MRDSQREAQEDRRLQRIGVSVDWLDQAFAGPTRQGAEYRGLTVRPPKPGSAEFLLVIRGEDAEGGPLVAFHSATDLSSALEGLAERLRNGSLQWRVDEYAKKG